MHKKWSWVGFFFCFTFMDVWAPPATGKFQNQQKPPSFWGKTMILSRKFFARTPSFGEDALFLTGEGAKYRQAGKQPLVALAELIQRRPLWPSILPSVFAYLQRKAEKAPYGQKDIQLLLNFWRSYPPQSFQGWVTYAQQGGPLTEKVRNHLEKFWTDHDMDMVKQRQLMKSYPFLGTYMWRQKRLAACVVRSEKAFAIAMHLFSPEDPLLLAGRLRKKKAATQDLEACLRYESIPPSKRPALLDIAFMTLLLRQRKPVEALALWHRLNLHLEEGWAYQKDQWGDSIIPHLAQIERSIMRDLWQQSHILKAEGRENEARILCEKALKMRTHSLPGIHDDEFLWIKGFICYAGLGDYQKASSYFLALVPEERNQEKAALMAVQNARKAPLVLQPNSRDRYKAKGLFWAGLCQERLGNKNQAALLFEKAGRYPFYFYGQMGLAKANKPLRIVFPKIDPLKGMQGEPQKLFSEILSFWLKNLPRVHAKTAETLPALITDAIQIAQTPEDRNRVLGWVKYFDPRKVTFIAKKLSTRANSVFPETFPTRILPRRPFDAALVHAIMLAETCFDEHVVSAAGARGIMQIMPEDVPELAAAAGVRPCVNDLCQPDYGMILGITELALKKQVHKSYISLIAAYNAGSHRVEKWMKDFPVDRNREDFGWIWIESIPFEETRAYVPRVLEHRNIYKCLLGGQPEPKEMLTLCLMHGAGLESGTDFGGALNKKVWKETSSEIFKKISPALKKKIPVKASFKKSKPLQKVLKGKVKKGRQRRERGTLGEKN